MGCCGDHQNVISKCICIFKMKSVSLVLFLVAGGCSMSTAFIAPEPAVFQNSLAPIQRQQFDLYASSRRLIEQLVEALRKAARESYEAIARFSASVQEEAQAIRNRIVTNIQKFRERVNDAIEAVRNRLLDSGVAIIDCIASHRGDANALFNETVTKTMSCVDERINEVKDQITAMRTLANDAMDFGNKALVDMKKCTEENGNFVATGSCLGTITMQAEWKAMVFATQSAFSIGRINLSIATLPAALEVCAGSRLVDSGMSTARILMDIGTCSATSVFYTMTGNTQPTLNLSNSTKQEE